MDKVLNDQHLVALVRWEHLNGDLVPDHFVKQLLCSRNSYCLTLCFLPEQVFVVIRWSLPRLIEDNGLHSL